MHSSSSSSSPVKRASTPPKRRSHVQPRRPEISLNEAGRLRTAHVMALLGVSHSTLYLRLKSGDVPPPDGKDGRLVYWKTATIRALLGETPG